MKEKHCYILGISGFIRGSLVCNASAHWLFQDFHIPIVNLYLVPGFAFGVSPGGHLWRWNTVFHAGWIDHECFMREELTLSSSCSLVCDSSFIWDLVNPLYVVSFLLFLPGHLTCVFE